MNDLAPRAAGALLATAIAVLASPLPGTGATPRAASPVVTPPPLEPPFKPPSDPTNLRQTGYVQSVSISPATALPNNPVTITVTGAGKCDITVGGIPTPVGGSGSLPITVQTANLPAGTYTIKVNPGLTCQGGASATLVVANPPPPSDLAQPAGLHNTASKTECLQHFVGDADDADSCGTAVGSKAVMVWSWSPGTCSLAPKCKGPDEFDVYLSQGGGRYVLWGTQYITPSTGFIGFAPALSALAGACVEVQANANGDLGPMSAPYCFP